MKRPAGRWRGPTAIGAGSVLLALALHRLALPSGDGPPLTGAGGLPGFWLAYALLGAAVTAVAWRRPRRIGLAELVAGAAVLRVVVVLTATPQLSDDIWRYVHDGATLAAGENPYARAPADVPPGEAPVPAIHDRINHPELATIYPPTSQWAFAGLSVLYRATPAAWKAFDPGRDRLFRLGLVILELAAIALLGLWLRARGEPVGWAGLYAFHPLALAEVAGAGHQEPLGIVLLVTGLWAGDRALRRGGTLAASGSGLALAASAAVKPVAVPILLPLAWRGRDAPRTLVAAGAAFALGTLALYAPFLAMEGGMSGALTTAGVVAEKWAFNGGLAAAIEAFAGPLAAHSAAALAVGGVILVAAARGVDAARIGLAVPLAALLLATTVHPWYLLWPLSLAPLVGAAAGARGRRWPPELAGVWVWALTVPIAYVAWLDPSGYQVRAGFRVLEYGPVLAAIVWGLFRGAGTTRRPRLTGP